MSQDKESVALDRMIVREDVLQICYWFQGEGVLAIVLRHNPSCRSCKIILMS